MAFREKGVRQAPASRSIVRRVTAASIGLVVCGLLFAIAGSLWILYRQSVEQYETRLDEQLSVLAGSLEQPLWSFDEHTIRTICETYSAHSDVVSVAIFSDDPDRPICRVETAHSGGRMEKTRLIEYEGQVIGGVDVAISKTAHEDTVSTILWFGLGSAALICSFIFLGVRRLLGVFLQTPLTTLSDWAGEVGRGRYGAVEGNIREVELQGLARRFQDMAAVLAARELELRKLSMATEQSPASVIITDPDGRVDYVNRTFEEITGFRSDEVRGRPAGVLLAGELSPAERTALWQRVRSGHTWQGEVRGRTVDGREIWERTRVAAIQDDDGRILHYIAVKEDITLQKEQAERIEHQALYDGLTDLPNRFLCMDRLSRLIREVQRRGDHLAVLFLDLDDFKKVNDSLGHEVGDKLLVQAARRLAGAVRTEDTLGRLGGDEFLVLAGGLRDPEDATALAEHLIEQVRRPFRIDGRELMLTVSVGIACCPEDGASVAELLRKADTAMYHSKGQGRNTLHYFTPAMNASVSRRLALEENLQGALERGEFRVVYQPIVSAGTGDWVGAEALLRWHTPALGEVSPAEFIPVAEQTGLILPIGLEVLRQAVAAVRLWRSRTQRALTVAVNLSPQQLRDPGLAGHVDEILREGGLTGDCLTLEITEGVLMSGQAQTDRVLQQLLRLGVGIGMDDFGTGYSSLSYLRSYPFSTLKIDRTFVADINRDPADRELVNAAIHMGNALGMRVIAEGVETRDQLRILSELGCRLAQGFLFSKPVPESAFTESLRRRSTAG
ncbi:EAL domain-containing protein [Ectothiorhodospiraceae bacterium WFHF3C12]|nr:EAL domain-containing protein [Ectothiorhodospiraceae bacterium WFHF3C12]